MRRQPDSIARLPHKETRTDPRPPSALTEVERNFRTEARSGVSGAYLFPSLSPGNYSIKVEAPGFDSFVLEAVTVEVNGNDLPLVNRNPFDLAFLAPGVSQAPGLTYGNSPGTPGFVTNFVSDGSRNAQADLLLDGVSIMNSDNNPGIQKALYAPPVEAIQEFKIQQTNFSAEFGNSGGTIVNVITRSGTNQFHGELFEFFRNNVLNANAFFANAAGLAQPHLTRNDFGVTAGGPLIKNKTFFFFDFNGIRALTRAASSIAGVPDAAERAGNFGELCGRAGGTFNGAGICSKPGGQIYDPYTSQPNAQSMATGRAPVPFDNLATYVSPGDPAIPFGLGILPPSPGNLIDPVGAKLIQAFPLPNRNVGTGAYDPYHNIPGGRRRITFAFAGLSLSIPERVRFRYRLENFDRDWSGGSAGREAVYTNLGPGSYRFRVIASNPDGVWSEKEAVIPFVVDPMFWQTWWFRCSCAAAAVLIVLAIYRLRMCHLTRELNNRFEERLAERTRIAQELHDTLLQGFLSASMQVHVAASRLPADSPSKPLLARSLELMRQVIDEGRNAVRGLRATRTASLDLE